MGEEMPFPKTLLLTWWPPDLRYAGGEFVRRIVERLPAESVRWASLERRSAGPVVQGIVQKSFAGPDLHWRLRRLRTVAVFRAEIQARAAARRIVGWAGAWRPDVLWVLPELGAVTAGLCVARHLAVPLHATVHDAHECAAFGSLPSWYVPFYVRRSRMLLKQAASVDAISEEMLTHIRRTAGRPDDSPDVIFCPSLPDELIRAVSPLWVAGPNVLRIVVCGSRRTTPEQWHRFLSSLVSHELRVELVLVGDARRDFAPPAGLGIEVEPCDYMPEDGDLIEYLASCGAHLAYAGVWNEPGRALFARTSLSSKIAAYAAAGLPVVFDGPDDAAAWHLLFAAGAGVRWDGSPAALEAIQRLRSGRDAWAAASGRALALCRDQLSLNANVHRMKAAIIATANRKKGEC